MVAHDLLTFLGSLSWLVSAADFLVNGTLNGSWLGLDPSVTVVNWGAGDLDTGRQGLEFFSQRGHAQIFAGYYDSHNGVASATTEVQIASDNSTTRGRIAGVDAWMYTTWRNNYTEMCRYAETIQNLTAAGSSVREKKEEE